MKNNNNKFKASTTSMDGVALLHPVNIALVMLLHRIQKLISNIKPNIGFACGIAVQDIITKDSQCNGIFNSQ